MRSRIPHVILALGALAATLATAHAGDPKAYAMPKRSVWRAGDAVTVTLSSSQKQSVKTSKADGTVVSDVTAGSAVEATWVESVIEADERGDAKRALVYLKHWSFKDREKADASICGAIVEVTGTGKNRAWRFVGAPLEPSAGAKSWLDGRFGADGMSAEASESAYMPKKPVAVGESWDLDPAPMIESAAKCMPTDAAKAKGTCTLVGADGGQAHIAFSIALPLTGLPCDLDGKAAAWTRGGTLTLSGERWVALDGRPLTRRHSTKGSLEGAASITGPEGSGILAMTQEMSEVESVAPGGEIPEPPRGESPIPK